MEIGPDYVDYAEYDWDKQHLVIVRERDYQPLLEEAKAMRNAEGQRITGSSKTNNKHIAFVPDFIPIKLHQEGKISTPLGVTQDDKKVIKKTIERDYPALKTVDWRIA